MKLFLSFIMCLLLCSCGTPSSKINNISTGMTREEVVRGLGQPLNTTNDGSSEIMNYRLVEDAWAGTTYPYVVVIQGGKVASYGRMGSDSSANPPQYQPIFIPTK